jgi:hypothetical protein
MKTYMKRFYELPGRVQEELLANYKSGELESTRFPFKGKVVDGIIFMKEEVRYLVPTDTIARVKLDPLLGVELDLSFEEGENQA